VAGHESFHGNLNPRWQDVKDATMSEVFVLGTLTCLVVIYGFVPQMITSRFEPDVTAMAVQYNTVHRAMPGDTTIGAQLGDSSNRAVSQWLSPEQLKQVHLFSWLPTTTTSTTQQ